MLDKKTILYVILGVVIFALWDTWQKDYGTTKLTTAHNATTATSDASHPVSGTDNVTSAAQGAHLEPIPDKRLITVRTDVLEIAIDSVGGNIVRADLVKYPETLNQPKPIRLLDDSAARYHVVNSSLFGTQGPDSNNKSAHYSIQKTDYILAPTQDELQVDLVWHNKDGLEITKVFTFKRDKYDFAVNYKITNHSLHPWSGKFLATIKRKEFDNTSGFFQFNTYTGAALSSKDIPYEKLEFAEIAKATEKHKENIRTTQGGWVAMQQRYFLSIWIPSQEQNYNYFCRAHDGLYTVGLSTDTLTVPSKAQETVGATLYIGPDITENFAHFARGLDRTVDYKWLWHIAVLFFWVLKKIYQLVGNWGWAIILVTLLIKLLFYKLSESSGRSMAKMRDLMPKIQILKERYGDDRQKLHQATMELYKREKINPLNLGGCLPMLIQIPFFLALYYVLIGAVELRHAPFIFWLHDLAARDPYYVLPILMGLSMLIQQRLTPSSADPAQAKMMMFMPVIFTLFFLNFPAGLVLYWFVSNLLSILQQWYINKKLEHAKK